MQQLQKNAPLRRRISRTSCIAATNSARLSGWIRYSMVTMTGPLSGSGVSASTGAGQSIDGVKSRTA